ncbi:MAG: hypothetical protein QMC80_02100 [Thermoplasmatales archaeon]|nr:hypothetical protein [Thermoplasmatales archaeon]
MRKEYEWYDLEKLWKETSISRKKFEKLKKEVRKEFPNDKMMYELHVMRALMQREEEKKNLSFEEIKKLRDERIKKGLAEVGFKLVKLGDGTYRIKKIRSR